MIFFFRFHRTSSNSKGVLQTIANEGSCSDEWGSKLKISFNNDVIDREDEKSVGMQVSEKNPRRFKHRLQILGKWILVRQPCFLYKTIISWNGCVQDCKKLDAYKLKAPRSDP